MKIPDQVREFFRKQGKIGAAKRQASTTPEQRSASAKLAAETRWARAKTDTKTTKKSKRTGGTK